jgi:hypothetical protein
VDGDAVSAAAVCVRLRRALDLRYLSAGNFARCGWPLARIADALEVSPVEARAMVDDAVAESGARVRWCGARGCDAYVIGATSHGAAMAAALGAARAAGWRFDGRGVLRCKGCT